MCGIAGEVSYSNSIINDIDSFYKMQKVLEPRGPDQNGLYIKDNVDLYLTGSNSSLPTLHNGQTQSSGRASNATPGSIPCSGSPISGS